MATKKYQGLLKTIGVILLLAFVALVFGRIATGRYLITLSLFWGEHNTGLLPFDFAAQVGVLDKILSIAYIVLWMTAAFFSGRRGWQSVFRGMMAYSALPFIGLLGYFFLKRGMKAGILLLLTIIWGYPLYPMLITQNIADALIRPLGIMLVLMPLGALIFRKIGKTLQ